MKRVRSLVRACAALVVWLHALFLLPVSLPSIARLAHVLRLQSTETTILLLLASLSLLSSYGWKSVAFDCFYIYFFPFILLFQALMFVLSPIFKGTKKEERTLDLTVAASSQPTANAAVVSRATARAPLKLLRRFLFKYTFLWCVLIVFSTQPVVLWIALSVAFAHAGRAVARALRVALKADGWLGEFDKKLLKLAEDAIEKVKAAETQADEKDLRNAVLMLGSFYGTVKLLESRPQVTRFFIAASLILFVCAYIYFGFLFSFLYYGLARIQSISYSWPNALVTSLFIPALVGTLPNNVWIKAVGGLHWLLVVAGGVGSLVSYMQKRLTNLYSAIDTLTERLNDSELERKFTTLNQRFNPKAATAPTTVVEN